MAWQRHGNLSRKVIRKVFALVVVLIGIRLIWVSFYSWNSPTIIDENIVQSRKNSHAKDLKNTKHEAYDKLNKDTETDRREHIQNIKDHLHGKHETPVHINTDSAAREKALSSVPDPNSKDLKAKTEEQSKPKHNDKNNVQDPIRKVTKKPATKEDVKTAPDKESEKTNSKSQKEDSKPRESEKYKEVKAKIEKVTGMFKDEVENGMCKLVNEWKNRKHNGTSTYDLFEDVDYSMDGEGQYPIPVRTFKEISKDESQKPLSVILVPFSHADPGYGLTIEQYYAQMTHSTLDNLIEKLMQYPNMTFQWAETVFLARWFEDLEETKQEDVRKLIQRGQFEIVLGGWVMPDEASPNYIAVVDQLIEGHQWLIENLGVKPTSAWVNDPFGYSSTMPYLWKSSGLDNLVFLRINQPVKAKLMKKKSLDFMWRPYWKQTNEMDLLSSLMSYTNYWMGDVCGPDPTICQQFNFLHLGSGDSQGIVVTDKNVAERAKVLYEQFRITGDLYKYNTLYIGLGEDFSYPQSQQWDNVYLNYEKLINYINSQGEWKMTVKFGTLKEYFSNVRKEEKEMVKTDKEEGTFPILSGDFFPYTERNQEFWTGYFTTRPLNKRFSREIETLVRAADIFNVIAYSSFKYYDVEYSNYAEIAKRLRYARRELGMFMHHDGITGTSLPHVVMDYEQRLFKANEQAHDAFKMVLLALLTKGKKTDPKLLRAETIKPESKTMTGHVVLNTTKEHSIVFVNPLSKKRKEVVSLRVTSKHFVIVSSVHANSPIQVVTHKGGQDPKVPLTVSFEVTIPPFGIEVYKMSPATTTNSRVEVVESLNSEENSTLTIENMHMKVEFDRETGGMKRIIDKDGKSTDIAAKFMVYQSKTSGAYIFGPTGPASDFTTKGKHVVEITQGPLMSEVKVTSKAFTIRVILYNTTSSQGQGLHIKTEVDMKAASMSEMEVILRFQTDVKNGNQFYTDQNGFQLIGRQNRPRDPIESNFYPVTTMAILEDDTKRFSLHCRQPHGGASLKEGQLEVMLDRHTLRDDKRGLGQGVYDNVRVNNDFIVHLEHKKQQFQPSEKRYTYSTEDSILMNDFLQNEIIKYISTGSSTKLSKTLHPLKTEFPCDVSVVGFRNLVNNNLEYNGTSLVLHRKPMHCGYKPINGQCKKQNTLTVKTLFPNSFPRLNVKITETSLSHLYDKKQLTPDTDLAPDYMELRAFRVNF